MNAGTPHRPTVLVLDADPTRARAIGEACGLPYRTVGDIQNARTKLSEAPDVLVVDAHLDGSEALELLGDLQERRALPLTILFADAPGFEECRRAWRLGAAEFLATPVDPARIAELVHDHLEERRDRAHLHTHLHLAQSAGPDAPELLAREASAFAMRHGAAPAARARLASAVHELVLNACEHGFSGGPGELALDLECRGDELHGRLTDRGVGFDADRARLDGVPSPLTTCFEVPSGLTRVASLVESLKVASSDAGTTVDFTVSFVGSTFEGELDRDFSELDWFDTRRCKQVMRAVQRNDHDSLLSLPPALAVVLGRLLAGSSADRIAHETLWS